MQTKNGTINIQNCFKTVKASNNLRKTICTLVKTSKLINKRLKESCDNSDSEIEVCINSDSYPETIDSVAPDEVLGNSTSL